MPDWLELELAEELRPAAAPDELWERIRSSSAGGGQELAAAVRGVPSRLRPRLATRRETSWASWPIAAIVTLMIAAATLWLVAKGQEPAVDLQQLAIQELRDPGALDLRSSDPRQVNDWLRREARVELTIPAQTGARLTGARTIQRGGARIGVVTYRIGNDSAALLVARAAASADFGHGRVQWQTRGQAYALASSNPDRPEAACLLCHAAL